MKLSKIIIIIFIFIAATGLIFALVKSGHAPTETNKTQGTPAPVDGKAPPQIVSTKPDPLNGAIVSASQPIELVFNRGLENEGELKVTIEPKINFKITLSQDRKTAKIIPQEPYDLGITYTMFIKGDTKFTGYGPWGEEKMFHFQTVRYRGV